MKKFFQLRDIIKVNNSIISKNNPVFMLVQDVIIFFFIKMVNGI